MLIAASSDLAEFIGRIRGSDVLAVDAEFMRERTYYPRLCLLQLATDEEAVAVDALSAADLGLLAPVMLDPHVTKVFHAGTQDIEILHRVLGTPPAPVFDTQVAATLAGFGSQVSYQDLVSSVLGVRLDKGQRFTDWSARPLSEAQVGYALDDVRHLPRLYREMRARLERAGRLGWLAEEFERMADPATYEVDPGEQFKRVKRAASLKGQQLAVLREVAAWREREAQKRDVPKRWLAADETLVEIARRAPRSQDELTGIRGMSDQVLRRHGRDILAAVERGLAVPRHEWPLLPAKARTDVKAEVVDLMAAVVRVRAREHGVAPALLASRDDLEAFAQGDAKSSLASGWRHAMVGADLEGLLRGEVVLGVERGTVRMLPAPTCVSHGSDPEEDVGA